MCLLGDDRADTFSSKVLSFELRNLGRRVEQREYLVICIVHMKNSLPRQHGSLRVSTGIHTQI